MLLLKAIWFTYFEEFSWKVVSTLSRTSPLSITGVDIGSGGQQTDVADFCKYYCDQVHSDNRDRSTVKLMGFMEPIDHVEFAMYMMLCAI